MPVSQFLLEGVLQVRFILAVISGDLKVSNRKKKDIEADLEEQRFDRMPKVADNGKKAAPKENDNDEEEEEEAPASEGSYDYLLSMAIQNLTEEKVLFLL
jgi:DNA topoisomerase II